MERGVSSRTPLGDQMNIERHRHYHNLAHDIFLKKESSARLIHLQSLTPGCNVKAGNPLCLSTTLHEEASSSCGLILCESVSTRQR